MINMITVKTIEEMGRAAASVIEQEIRNKPDIVLGLATGSSPVSLYKELIRLNREEGLDFANVRTVNLDEYVGLEPDHPQSYRYFMNENLFDHINIDPKNTHLPDGTAADLTEECAGYDLLIDEIGGIDLQLLGIGVNGHIGFNEPADEFSNKTSAVPLTDATINANARFFDDISEVPREAITLDIRHIMQALKIVLVATAGKKDIIVEALYGKITPQVPASVLQLHRDVTVVFSEGE